MFKLAETMLYDKEDLIHKANGWALRFAGDQDRVRLLGFLDQYAAIHAAHDTSLCNGTPRKKAAGSVSEHPEGENRMTGKKTGITSMDEYIATFPDDMQKILQELRSTIKSAAPEAEEKISYGMPTFMLNGKYLIYFAGWKNHISVYPVPTGSDEFNRKIAPYIAGKGTLKFPLDKPLPLDLVTEMVKLHLAGNLEKNGIKSNYGNKGEKK